jgi:hypothetical protein
VKEAHEQCTRARPLSPVGRQRRLIVVALAAVSCHLGGSGLCTCTPGRCRGALAAQPCWFFGHAGLSGSRALFSTLPRSRAAVSDGNSGATSSSTRRGRHVTLLSTPAVPPAARTTTILPPSPADTAGLVLAYAARKKRSAWGMALLAGICVRRVRAWFGCHRDCGRAPRFIRTRVVNGLG